MRNILINWRQFPYRLMLQEKNCSPTRLHGNQLQVNAISIWSIRLGFCSQARWCSPGAELVGRAGPGFCQVIALLHYSLWSHGGGAKLSNLIVENPVVQDSSSSSRVCLQVLSDYCQRPQWCETLGTHVPTSSLLSVGFAPEDLLQQTWQVCHSA